MVGDGSNREERTGIEKRGRNGEERGAVWRKEESL